MDSRPIEDVDALSSAYVPPCLQALGLPALGLEALRLECVQAA